MICCVSRDGKEAINLTDFEVVAVDREGVVRIAGDGNETESVAEDHTKNNQ